MPSSVCHQSGAIWFLFQLGAMPSGYVNMVPYGFFLPMWCKCQLLLAPINLVPSFFPRTTQHRCHLLLLSTWCHAICLHHQLGTSAIWGFYYQPGAICLLVNLLHVASDLDVAAHPTKQQGCVDPASTSIHTKTHYNNISSVTCWPRVRP